MAGAIQRGLTLSDFNDLTVGQIVDYCIEYNNSNYVEDEEEKEDTVREATQEDMDRWQQRSKQWLET